MERFLRKEVVVDTPIDGSTKTKGGFTISNDRVDYLTGNVVQIGDEVEKVSVGDKVVFLAKALNTCNYEDKSFNFVIEENIICVDG